MPPGGTVGWERPCLPSPSQRYPDAGTWGEKPTERDENVDKWSERVILSKDIKSHGDSIVYTLTVMNFKTTQLRATLPAF